MILLNRGYAITREQFSGGVAIEFDWRWEGDQGTYCDDLTVCVRTRGRPDPKWSHEAQDGIAIRFSPEEGQISLIDRQSGHSYGYGQGPNMQAEKWHRVRIEDDGTHVVIFFEDLQTPVVITEVYSQSAASFIAIYNREPVGGIRKMSLVDNLIVSVPLP